MREQMERMRESSYCPKYMQVWNPVEEPDGQLCVLIWHLPLMYVLEMKECWYFDQFNVRTNDFVEGTI